MEKSGKTNIKIIQKRVKGLSSFIEISRIINSTLDLGELLGIVMKIAKQVIRAEASSLMLIDEQAGELVYEVALGSKGKEVKKKFRLKIGQGIAGWVAKYQRPLLVKDVTKDRRFFGKPDQTTGFKTKSILCVPMKVRGKIIGVLQAINPLDREMFDQEDIDLFTAFASQAAIAIANARMHKDILEKQKVEQELAIASQIQQNFLSGTYPKVDGISLYARSIPAREIGGDFYDFIKLDRNCLGIVIGDVSGKGVPAALYMVKTMTELRNQASQFRQPDKLLHSVNNILVKKTMRGMFVTLIYMVLDAKKKTISFSNAGHLSPVFLDIPSRKISLLEKARSLPLGILPDVEYTKTEIDIKGNKLLLAYTDGIIEARNKKSVEFSLQRLKKMIKKKEAGSLPVKATVNFLIDEVLDFSREVVQHDDLTALAIRIVESRKKNKKIENE
ncbi:MAG: GAF domain-containing SpoIIE family protein phosphatase [Candidatus Omnitrophota bacterium]|nr:GAF domain-containing SpoIIE family protein phosphatase [Candidatus Omnitrophota bacterium]